MAFTKSLAFFVITVIGFGVFATVIYQSGVIQSLKPKGQDKPFLGSNNTKQKMSLETTYNNSTPLLSNPKGKIAIAIIRPKPPLENIILNALENGSMDVKF